MSVHEWSLRIGALLVSLLLHGLLFLHTGSTAGNNEQPSPQRTVTHVSFRSVAAPQAMPQVPQDTPVKPPEPEVTEAPEPPPKPQPPKREQRAKKARQPEPAPQPTPQQEVAPSAPTTEEAEKSPVAAEAVAGTVQDPALIKQAKQEYLRRLMAHIEAHKEYPRAARRRRIEGDVHVVFTLLTGGGIAAVATEGGHHLLAEAARNAVKRAAPMPSPPERISLPWKVAFTMRFTIQ